MRLLSARRLCRLAATGLAVAGLTGHGLAMLLIALLAGGTASAAAPFYGEICAASGSATADSVPQGGEGVPRPAQGHIDACPVCAAFAHCGPAALPAPLTLPGAEARGAGWQRGAETAPPACVRLAAQSRGPPAA